MVYEEKKYDLFDFDANIAAGKFYFGTICATTTWAAAVKEIA
jgi:hypothetical protein